MSLIVFGFLFTLGLSFGLILLLTKPGKEQEVLNRRVEQIRGAGSTGMGSFQATSLLAAKQGPVSSTWAEHAVQRYRAAGKLQRLIMQSSTGATFEHVVYWTLGLALGGFAVSYLVFPLLPVNVGIGIILGLIPTLFLAYKRAKRMKAFDAELSNAVDMMSNALRAGHSVVGAIGILAEQALDPVGSEFKEVFRQQNFGLPLRDALLELLDRVPSPDLRVVITAILVQKDTGGNLGEILDRVVFVIRERFRIKGEIKTQTAQGRMTGWILTALPVVMLVLINIVNPGYSRILLTDPTGKKLMYAGVVLIIFGGLTIRHLVNKIEV